MRDKNKQWNRYWKKIAKNKIIWVILVLPIEINKHMISRIHISFLIWLFFLFFLFDYTKSYTIKLNSWIIWNAFIYLYNSNNQQQQLKKTKKRLMSVKHRIIIIYNRKAKIKILNEIHHTWTKYVHNWMELNKKQTKIAMV